MRLFTIFFLFISTFSVAQPDQIQLIGCTEFMNGVYTRAVGEDIGSCPCYEGASGVIFALPANSAWHHSTAYTDCASVVSLSGNGIASYTNCDITIETVLSHCANGTISEYIPVLGACCLPDGSCNVDTEGNCTAAGGVYQGDDVLCPDFNTTWYADFDNDGYSDGTTVSTPCQPDGYKPFDELSGSGSDDCDDTFQTINPSAQEICDGIDNNCDDLIDDNDPTVIGQNQYFPDNDGDGFGSGVSLMVCGTDPPLGYVANSLDCNDDDSTLTIVGSICDDGNDATRDDLVNENCECIGSLPIPTLSQWGLFALSVIMLILGIVVVRQRKAILR